MCLINNDHVIGLTVSNPLDAVVRQMREGKQCLCSGKGNDGLCKCEKLQPWSSGVVPSAWIDRMMEKPRFRVKAKSVRY